MRLITACFRFDSERAHEDMAETVQIQNVKAVRETEAALLVEVEGEEEIWIPKSQIHDDSEVYKMDTEGTLVIPLWLAEKHGLV